MAFLETGTKLRSALARTKALGACLSTVFLLLTLVSAASAAPKSARPADSFVNSIGINTHLYYSDTPYGQNFGTVKARLAELGVRHIRENLAPNNRPDQYQHLRELAAMGIKGDLILGDPTNGIPKLDWMISTVKSQLSGALDAVEGPNEFDARGISNWRSQLVQYQQHLYSAVKSDPQLSSLTVVGPSIVFDPHEKEVGNISQMLDVGNSHSYAPLYAPEKLVPEFLERAKIVSGSKPVWATETGYNTALGYNGDLPPVSEAAMASYMPRVFLEHFRQGFARTYSYELLDEFPDPGQTNRESHWGLLRNDLSPKPAFESVKNLIGILSDPGPEFNPGQLDYTVGGNQSELRQVLLQKRDGSFYLALWRAQSVWDLTNRLNLSPSSSPVSISFGQSIEKAERFLPNSSAGAVESIRQPRSLNVEVGPNVVILRLTPGSSSAPVETPAPEAPAPEVPTPEVPSPESIGTPAPAEAPAATKGPDASIKTGPHPTEAKAEPTATIAKPEARNPGVAKKSSKKRHGKAGHGRQGARRQAQRFVHLSGARVSS